LRTLFCFLILLFVADPIHAAPNLPAQIAGLLEAQRLEGAVWTTLDSHGAAGVSNRQSQEPMRPDHKVQVGSIAKPVLATGILRLITERRLSLDTPVSELLPSLSFDNTWNASDPVRIRHLLDHTSGLDDIHFWHVFSTSARADTPLTAAFPPDGGLLRVRHRPGKRHSYSNMGYTLLGMVIEVVTGQRYESYLDSALLAPLGMYNSTFGFVTQSPDTKLAMGHFENGIAQRAMPSYVRPAGQLTTTAVDMAHFARFLMSDGSVDGKRFIDQALLRQMSAPAHTEAARAGLQVGYGLGLRRLDRDSAVANCHGGSTIGFKAMLCMFPEVQKAFFIAFNTDSEMADYQAFNLLLARAVSPAQPKTALASPTAAGIDSRPWQGCYIPAPNRFDTMRLIDTVFGALLVRAEGANLSLHPLQGAAVSLTPIGTALYRAPGKILPSHALLVSAEGRHVITTGTQSYEKVPAMYLVFLSISIAAGICGLAWITIKGLVQVSRRRMSWRDPLAPALTGALVLLLPLPLFFAQSYLQLGEMTSASVSLAIATAALPLAMVSGLVMAIRLKKVQLTDTAAMAAVLQFAVVLAAWGLLPLKLWA